MAHLEFSKRFAGLLASCLALALVAALSLPMLVGLERTAAENGPLEWAQEALLLAAVVFSGAAVLSLRGAERMAAYLATLLYLVFLLRELELPEVGPLTRYLASDAFRWHEALSLAGLVAPYVLLRARHLRALLAYGLALSGWPFLLAALLVGLGAAFDGVPSLGGTAHLGTFLEETAELLGYAVLALAAGWVLAGAQAHETAEGEAADAVACGARRT